MRDFGREPMEELWDKSCYVYSAPGSNMAHESAIDKGFVRDSYFSGK